MKLWQKGNLMKLLHEGETFKNALKIRSQKGRLEWYQENLQL